MFLSTCTELLRSNLLCFCWCPFAMVLSLGAPGMILVASLHVFICIGEMPNWGPFHRKLFPAMWVTLPEESFRHSRLQSLSLMGPHLLPGNLLQHGILSSQVCSSLPGACSGTVFPQVGSPPSGLPLLQHPWAVPGASPQPSPWLQGDLSPAPPAPLPWLSAGQLLSHALTPLFSGFNYICIITSIFLSLKYVITEV